MVSFFHIWSGCNRLGGFELSGRDGTSSSPDVLSDSVAWVDESDASAVSSSPSSKYRGSELSSFKASEVDGVFGFISWSGVDMLVAQVYMMNEYFYGITS